MRLWHRQSNAAWITDSKPAVNPVDFRTVIMVLGVWLGFAVAIHFAGSPKLYAAVDHLNELINPLVNTTSAPAPLDHDALIVTADHTTELTAVATLSPRGYRPVIAAGEQDALDRVHADAMPWKLVVIDASLPGSAKLNRAIRELLPGANIVEVQGRHGAQAVSRALMERLSAPATEHSGD